MDEATDRPHATSSPEEMALHFLLRHAECRSALTGQTGEDRPYDASEPAASGVRATDLIAADSRRSEDSRPGKDAAAAGVTNGDSCTARFLRAYAAARHIRVDIEKVPSRQTATLAGADTESDLKQGF